MKKLMSLSAFYKNDLPGGIGIQLTWEFGDLDAIFETLTTNYRLMLRQSVIESETATLVRDLKEQLEVIGRTKVKGENGFHLAMMAIGNIWLLEDMKELKADEFNGVQLIWTETWNQ